MRKEVEEALERIRPEYQKRDAIDIELVEVSEGVVKVKFQEIGEKWGSLCSPICICFEA